jgi:hypothetical protein
MLARPPVERSPPLRNYHIFTGGIDGLMSSPDGLIIMEHERGYSRRVGGQTGDLLHDGETLRLVVLNACEASFPWKILCRGRMPGVQGLWRWCHSPITDTAASPLPVVLRGSRHVCQRRY